VDTHPGPVTTAILLPPAAPTHPALHSLPTRRSSDLNVRSGIPAVEAYYADNGTYVGMTTAALALIDAGVKITHVGTVSSTTYCEDAGAHGRTWVKADPPVAFSAGIYQ